MISAFLGYVFCDFSSVFKGDFSGLIPVLVMLVSALMMGISGLAVRKLKWSWIADYALPISLIAAKVGYTNFGHFSTSYKKFYHKTPQEERSAAL